MPKPTPAVRVAASSVLLLSLMHIVFWGVLASYVIAAGLDNEQFTLLFVALCLVSAGGSAGVVVALGLFRAKNWARVAVLALAALVASVCAFAILVLCILIFGSPSNFGLFDNLVGDNRNNLSRTAYFYLFVFSLAVWWIALFSRKSVADQFSAGSVAVTPALSKRAACPPPVALLAWLMILSSALSALSWPLILGRIPVMLFTHIFSLEASQWIWAANLLLFVACGLGLLRLQRWSYTGVIALHAFWLASFLFAQLSPLYETYTSICLDALELRQAYPGLSNLRFPQWLSALATAIPTALLIAGLFYYRPRFLKAVESSRHPSR
jgi:hypothetical protein